MISQFDHELLNGFYLWFENRLLKSDTKAYQTGVSNTFQYINFKDVPNGWYGYQGQYRQLVAEQNVDIPNSGIMVGGGFVSGDNSNIYIDYYNGRVIVPQASGSGLSITAVSTVKDVNVYLSPEEEEDIIIHSEFINRATAQTYLSENPQELDDKTYIIPACFVTMAGSQNNQHCLGGQEDTRSLIKVIVVAEDLYYLQGVLSRFRDTARTPIKHIPFDESPYGAFWSIKSYPYQYTNYVTGYSTTSFIERVTTSKLNSAVTKEEGKNFLVGFLDFELSSYRFPRV